MKKPFDFLTRKDFEILSILWKEDVPMTCAEIAEHGDKMSINTVQVEIRKLLKKDIIYVAEVGYSNTVLCRKYKVKLSKKDFVAEYYAREYIKSTEKKHITDLVCALLDKEKDMEKKKDEIRKLEEMLEGYKKCIDK